jgi:hypothetical protein
MDENRNPIREDWWTPDQIELVEDVSRYWIKVRFVTVPGVWIPMERGRALRKLVSGEAIPEGATLDANAWDHEHCSLCWQKISENSGDLQEGYRSEDDWLCEECFKKYIGRQDDC